MAYYIAMDVGGTSIKTAVVDGDGHIVSQIKRFPSRSTEDEETILTNFSSILKDMTALATSRGLVIAGAGVGFPGPFDYDNGVCLMRGINKYDSIYGVNLKQELPCPYEIRFCNDADLYCLGECAFGEGQGFDRVMCVCIGTGLGSGFVADGALVKTGDCVPENGWLYHIPYRESIADHYISATGLRRMIKESTALQEIPDVKELDEAARAGNRDAIAVFEEFGKSLCEVVLPYAVRFGAQCLVLGGDVSKGFDLFSSPLTEEAAKHGITVRQSKRFSDNTLIAAPLLFRG